MRALKISIFGDITVRIFQRLNNAILSTQSTRANVGGTFLEMNSDNGIYKNSKTSLLTQQIGNVSIILISHQ